MFQCEIQLTALTAAGLADVALPRAEKSAGWLCDQIRRHHCRTAKSKSYILQT